MLGHPFTCVLYNWTWLCVCSLILCWGKGRLYFTRWVMCNVTWVCIYAVYVAHHVWQKIKIETPIAYIRLYVRLKLCMAYTICNAMYIHMTSRVVWWLHKMYVLFFLSSIELCKTETNKGDRFVNSISVAHISRKFSTLLSTKCCLPPYIAVQCFDI